MGKGDMRTRRGKIRRGTYGNARRKKRKKKSPEVPKPAKGGGPQ